MWRREIAAKAMRLLEILESLWVLIVASLLMLVLFFFPKLGGIVGTLIVLVLLIATGGVIVAVAIVRLMARAAKSLKNRRDGSH
jgi:hypothetical protein